MKKILVAGANSFVGTSVEKYLNQWPGRYQIETLDMRDVAWKKRSFAGFDVIFHVAGIAHSDIGRISKKKEKLYRLVNTELAIETAKKAKREGVKQFIFMSSIIVYGDSAPVGKEKIITIKTLPAPANCYGDSKLQAEYGIQALEDDMFRVVILRPPMIYGKNSKGNFPLLEKIAKKLSFFPLINNKRSMIYVENLAEFVRLMIENNEKGIFWPQNGQYGVTSEIVQMLAKENGRDIKMLSGLKWLIKFASCFFTQVNKAFGNLVYLQSMSDYKEDYRKYTLEESIRKVVK